MEAPVKRAPARKRWSHAQGGSSNLLTSQSGMASRAQERVYSKTSRCYVITDGTFIL